MKKIFILFFSLAFACLGAIAAYPQDINQELPPPKGWVNDFAGVISRAYKEKINNLIDELENQLKNSSPKEKDQIIRRIKDLSTLYGAEIEILDK